MYEREHIYIKGGDSFSFGKNALENVSFTIIAQHVHNTPSHKGGAHCVGPISCERVLC
jgi:hypothetical protein